MSAVAIIAIAAVGITVAAVIAAVGTPIRVAIVGIPIARISVPRVTPTDTEKPRKPPAATVVSVPIIPRVSIVSTIVTTVSAIVTTVSAIVAVTSPVERMASTIESMVSAASESVTPAVTASMTSIACES
jgi:hypothetical protein